MQTQTSNTLHNAIMEANGKDHPPMLAPGNYVQWKSRIKRYIDTKPKHELIHYCLKNPPYKFTWADKKVPISKADGKDHPPMLAPGNYVQWKSRIKRYIDTKPNHELIHYCLKNPPYKFTWADKKVPISKDDEMLKDKEIDKLMALISLSFKKIYKPTNNNLRTSSNTSRANQGNSPRINRGAGYDNQRLGNVAGDKETVGTTVVQKSRIQCYNCKEFGHVARECQKPKRAKDEAYYMEKMLLCKQEEAGIQLNAKQADWRDDTDDESEDQELKAHYMYMA
nr:hypothetical protein [Tanacetum cinerariifolium]